MPEIPVHLLVALRDAQQNFDRANPEARWDALRITINKVIGAAQRSEELTPLDCVRIRAAGLGYPACTAIYTLTWEDALTAITDSMDQHGIRLDDLTDEELEAAITSAKQGVQAGLDWHSAIDAAIHWPERLLNE